MSTLGPMEMYTYALAAGFAPSEAKVMARIGLAESGGKTDAVNPSSGNTGVWQIGPMGTVNDAGVHLSQAQLKNPVTNANAARTLFSGDKKRGGDGYGPWNASRAKWSPEAHWSLADKATAFIDATASIPGQVGSSAVGAAGSVVDTAGQIGRLATSVEKGATWFSSANNWLRIGYVIGGGFLVVAGLQMVVRSKVISEIGPALGGQVQGKVKAAQAASGANKQAAAKASDSAAKSKARVTEAYHKTLAREQAKSDAKAAKEQK